MKETGKKVNNLFIEKLILRGNELGKHMLYQ
jgi:hypothetical protein